MKRFCLTLAALLCSNLAAQAHHIWIVPSGEGRSTIQVVFSDTLKPDAPQLLEKIAHTRLWLRDTHGKEVSVAWQKQANSYALKVDQATGTIGGICEYGVEVHDHRLRRSVDPYLLVYYPKAQLGLEPSQTPWKKLTLEIVPQRVGPMLRLKVLFHGKPEANAEMIVYAPGIKRENLETNAEGWIEIPGAEPGVYGLRTRVLENKLDEHNGKSYVQVRHYASLVLTLE